jgi:hypothetical protein
LLDRRASAAIPGQGALAVDMTYAYYFVERHVEGSASWHDDLVRVEKNGGKSETLAEDCAGESLAVDARFVYVSQWQPGAIVRVPKTGGQAESLTRDRLDRPSALHDDGTSIYFADARPRVVASVPKTGGAVRQRVLDVGVRSIRIDATAGELYVLDEPTPREAPGRFQMLRLRTDGGPPALMVGEMSDCSDAFALDANHGLVVCADSFWRLGLDDAEARP